MDINETIEGVVAEYGWYVAKFEATEYLPSFAYTIGLWKNYKHPELIIFGLTTDNLYSILNLGGEIIKNGNKIENNQETGELFENSNAYIIEVNNLNLRDYFTYGIRFNNGAFPASQIVWTDRNCKYPWEEDYEKEFIYRQPLLDRNMAFKFREERKLGVVTNRHFTEEGQPILYVEHDEEGDWIFLTGDEWLTSDARLICLENIVNKDGSLNQLFNLDYGEFAKRTSINDEWIRGRYNKSK